MGRGEAASRARVDLLKARVKGRFSLRAAVCHTPRRPDVRMRQGRGASFFARRSALARHDTRVLVGSKRRVRQDVGAAGAGLLCLRVTSASHVRDDERDARDGEGKAQSRVKEGDEPLRQHAAHAQRDAAAHHDGHDDVALAVEEVPYMLAVFLEPANSFGMLAHKLLEHEHVEQDKDRQRERKNPPYKMVVRDHAYANIGDVATCHDPHDASNEEKFFSRDFHGRDYTSEGADFVRGAHNRMSLRKTCETRWAFAQRKRICELISIGSILEECGFALIDVLQDSIPSGQFPRFV